MTRIRPILARIRAMLTAGLPPAVALPAVGLALAACAWVFVQPIYDMNRAARAWMPIPGDDRSGFSQPVPSSSLVATAQGVLFMGQNAAYAVHSIAAGRLAKPMALAIDESGALLVAVSDGRIARVTDKALESVAHTGGSPRGIAIDPWGNIIVADTKKGLLRVTPAGVVSVLATGVDGMPFASLHSVTVASDGTIYFTDSGSGAIPTAITRHDYSPADGRLLAFDPDSGETRVLMDHIAYATGVALMPDEHALLVGEMAQAQLLAYRIDGADGGSAVPFHPEFLPGLPDGVTIDAAGVVYVAIPELDNTMAGFATLPDRRDLGELQSTLISFYPAGEYRSVAHGDSGGHLRGLTMALAHGGYLYFAGTGHDHVLRIARGGKPQSPSLEIGAGGEVVREIRSSSEPAHTLARACGTIDPVHTRDVDDRRFLVRLERGRERFLPNLTQPSAEFSGNAPVDLNHPDPRQLTAVNDKEARWSFLQHMTFDQRTDDPWLLAADGLWPMQMKGMWNTVNYRRVSDDGATPRYDQPASRSFTLLTARAPDALAGEAPPTGLYMLLANAHAKPGVTPLSIGPAADLEVVAFNGRQRLVWRRDDGRRLVLAAEPGDSATFGPTQAYRLSFECNLELLVVSHAGKTRGCLRQDIYEVTRKPRLLEQESRCNVLPATKLRDADMPAS